MDVPIFGGASGAQVSQRQEDLKKLRMTDPGLDSFKQAMMEVLNMQQAQFNAAMQQQMLLQQQQQQALMVEFMKHSVSVQQSSPAQTVQAKLEVEKPTVDEGGKG